MTAAQSNAVRAQRGPLSMVLLDGGEQPLHVQLYEALRRAITSGRVAAGTRLPSSRALAEQLDLGRNTAVHALQQLLDEGYAVTRRGAGTFVAAQRPDDLVAAPRRPPRPSPAPRAQPSASAALSRRGAAITSTRSLVARLDGAGAPFGLGVAALDAFPAEAWGRLLSRRWQRSSAALVRPPSPLGYAPLRRAVAYHLLETRGVQCVPEQVLIVSGSQQALRVVLDLVLDPGDQAWVEDPGPVRASAAVRAAGGVPVPIPVDQDGLAVERGEQAAPAARLAIVAPESQFPLLTTMSDERRRRLLAWAGRAGAWVFEDDRGSGIRFRGRPRPALQSVDPGRVIYAGGFGQVLGPSLRVGYLVVPESLREAAAAAKALLDAGSPSLEQSVLADFLAAGHFARHLRRVRRLYEERQRALVAAAAEQMDAGLAVRPAATGMHLVGWLPAGVDDTDAAVRAGDAGIAVHPLSMYRHQPGPPALLLGYAAFAPARIRGCVRALAAALRASDPVAGSERGARRTAG